jgi:hypothetical protein
MADRKQAQLERDATRYRWLRKRTAPGSRVGVWSENARGEAVPGGWLYGPEMDRAIDAAMKTPPPKDGSQ